jgi:hypothetical protein
VLLTGGCFLSCFATRIGRDNVHLLSKSPAGQSAGFLILQEE